MRLNITTSPSLPLNFIHINSPPFKPLPLHTIDPYNKVLKEFHIINPADRTPYPIASIDRIATIDMCVPIGLSQTSDAIERF